MNAWPRDWSRLPLWLQWGLGLILAWQLGSWSARVLQPAEPPPLPNLHRSEPDFERFVLTPNLFGTEKPVSARSQAVPKRKMRPEQLGIQVEGVIALEHGQGVAVVKHQGKSKAVRVGEQIAPNMRLEAVAPDSITVSIKGERVWVPLQKTQTHAYAKALSTANTPSEATAISPQALREVASTLRRNPFKVFEFARFQPVQAGLKVQARAGKAQWLAAVGLQDGDIVTAVDGQAVKVLMHQPPRWQKLMHKQQWQLEVIRNGVRQTIEVKIP